MINEREYNLKINVPVYAHDEAIHSYIFLRYQVINLDLQTCVTANHNVQTSFALIAIAPRCKSSISLIFTTISHI